VLITCHLHVYSRVLRLVYQMALNKRHPGEAGLSLPSCHGTFISKCPPIISCLHLTVLRCCYNVTINIHLIAPKNIYRFLPHHMQCTWRWSTNKVPCSLFTWSTLPITHVIPDILAPTYLSLLSRFSPSFENRYSVMPSFLPSISFSLAACIPVTQTDLPLCPIIFR
jgi:hypothetical protein